MSSNIRKAAQFTPFGAEKMCARGLQLMRISNLICAYLFKTAVEQHDASNN